MGRRHLLFLRCRQPQIRQERPAVYWILGLVLALFAACCFAQFDTATVLGTLRDPSGSVIPNAKVTLRNVNTGVTASTMTDEAGNFEFLTVRIGDYRVSAEAAGFAPLSTDTFNVAVNARQRVDLTMKIGASTESVTVTGAAALLESDSSDKGQVVNAELVDNLPLSGRNYSDLSLLVPGVQVSTLTASDVGSTGQPREGSFNVNGLASAYNNFMLDGVDNNAYGTSNQGFSNQAVQLSLGAVQEFKVQTNNYSAEYGRAGGAVVNVVTRGGTNTFHGSLHEYARNTDLNAVGFFKPNGGVKPTLIQNQFGGTVGGPILRDRMFFFASYEGYRRISRYLQYTTLPSMDLRQGIIGRSFRDPITGVTYSNGVLPAFRISSFARKVMDDLPAPNSPGSSNYQAMPHRRDFNDKGDIKIDRALSSRTSFFLRASQRKENNFIPPTIEGPSGGGSSGYVYAINQGLTLGGTFTPGTSQLLEARLGITRTLAGKEPPYWGFPDMLTAYGITGIPENKYFGGGLNTQTLSGFTTLGRQNTNPQHQDPLVLNPRVNYSRIKKAHTLKFGYEYQAVNTEIEDFHPKYGQDTYTGQFSRPSGAGSSGNYNMVDFLVGARDSYSISNYVVVYYRQRMQFGYVQDDWKPFRRLTVNAGLRYEYSTPQYERDNRLSNYDPATNSMIHAQGGSVFDRTLVHPDRNNFAPRFGLAFSLNRKTVIRSAYGISYLHFNRMGGNNMLSYNGPTIVSVLINQVPGPNFRLTQDGYPPNLAVPANYSTASSTVNYIPSDYRTPYVQSWHLTIQRELTRSLLMDVGYVGNHGTKLAVMGDWNQARPSRLGENLTMDQRRPIAGYGYMRITFNGNSSTYHALQAKLEKRYSKGFYLLNSFTWSKAIDFGGGPLEAGSGDSSTLNIRNIRGDRGVSGYDRTFNDITTITYQLPGGRGRAGYVYGGWRASLINTMTSGGTVNLTYTPASTAQVSSVAVYRPNIIGDPMTPASQRGPNNFLNKATVVVPNDPTMPFGNAGRNIARSSPLYQADVRLQKSFPLRWEKSRLDFLAECFNVLNKTNFRAPNGNRSSSAFGTITSAFPPRIMQFALRFAF